MRIEGAQRSHLSYLKNGEIKRAWFPKVTISILPPVKLDIDETLRGKAHVETTTMALDADEIDYNRDTGNALMEKHGFTGVSLVALDEDWSAMRFKVKE